MNLVQMILPLVWKKMSFLTFPWRLEVAIAWGQTFTFSMSLIIMDNNFIENIIWTVEFWNQEWYQFFNQDFIIGWHTLAITIIIIVNIKAKIVLIVADFWS